MLTPGRPDQPVLDAAERHRSAIANGILASLPKTVDALSVFSGIDANKLSKGLQPTLKARDVLNAPGAKALMASLDKAATVGDLGLASPEPPRFDPVAVVRDTSIDTSALQELDKERAAERRGDVERETRMVVTLEAVHAELVAGTECQTEALEIARRSYRWVVVAGVSGVVSVVGILVTYITG